MSGGFLGRALGLGRALLLRGFGGGSGAPPPVTGRPCAHIGAPIRVLTAAPSTPLRTLTATPGAALRTLTAMPGPAEAC